MTRPSIIHYDREEASSSSPSSWPFRRPPDSKPTRYLLLHSAPDSLDDIEAAAAPLAPAALHTRRRGGAGAGVGEAGAAAVGPEAGLSGPLVVLEFRSEEDAAAALFRITEGTLAPRGSRPITARYCQFKGKPNVEGDAAISASRDASSLGIPGLVVLPDFIGPAEEASVVGQLDALPWETAAKRRVQHHGYKFNYETRSFGDNLGPLPSTLRPLLSRAEAAVASADPSSCSQGAWTVDQVTANEYAPGVGIAPHVDTHSAFRGPILSLSLCGGTVMEFRCGTERRALYLPPRSLLIMSGESRLKWQHYIPHRKWDTVEGVAVARPARRVSLTLRMTSREPCACPYPEQCDSRTEPPPTRLALRKEERNGEGTEGTAAGTDAGRGLEEAADSDADADVGPRGTHVGGAAPSIESEHVHRVYEVIGPHFSSTRFAVWPEVRRFLEALQPGALVADVGCGNGKYLGLRPDVAMLGSDRSTSLVELAYKRVRGGCASLPPTAGGGALSNCDACVADGTQLPYRTAAFDAVICIAVLHHMSCRERRLAMLRQLGSLLVPGGQGLVTVWAMEQENTNKMAKWTQIESGSAADERSAVPADAKHGASRAVSDANANAAEGKDYFVPWHLPLHRPEGAAAAVALSSSAAAIGGASAAAAAGSAAAQGDTPVPAVGSQAVVFQRYYHLFTEAELVGLVEDAGGLEVVRSFYDKDNWCVVFRRAEGGGA